MTDTQIREKLLGSKIGPSLDFRVEQGLSAYEEPAVWVYVILPDEYDGLSRSLEGARALEAVRKLLDEIAAGKAIPPFHKEVVKIKGESKPKQEAREVDPLINESISVIENRVREVVRGIPEHASDEVFVRFRTLSEVAKLA